MLDAVDFIIIWSAAVTQTLFVILYGVVPWWRRAVGRALFMFSLALAAFIDMAVVNHYVDYPAEDAVKVAVHGLVLVGIATQLAVIAVRQFRDRAGFPGLLRRPEDRP